MDYVGKISSFPKGMRRIGIVLTKGGAGKTTTAVNLSHGLAQKDRNVLLIDTDHQGQVSEALDIDPPHGLADLIMSRAEPEQCIHKARERLYVLSGGISILDLEETIDKWGESGYELLSVSLAPLDDMGFFDYVIIDTPPAWSDITANVLYYVDEILCPIEMEPLSMNGLATFWERLKRVQEAKAEELGVSPKEALLIRYVMPSQFDVRNKQTHELLEQLEESPFSSVLTEPIRTNVRVSEAPGHGETIFEYDPTSSGAEDYEKLTELVISHEST